MIKAITLAATALLIGSSASAAQIGIRHSAGASVRNIHNGQSWSNYSGRTETETRTRTRANSAHVGSTTRSRTSSYENYNGGDHSQFTGGSFNVFSESSIFAN